jgi:hypothetical protein
MRARVTGVLKKRVSSGRRVLRTCVLVPRTKSSKRPLGAHQLGLGRVAHLQKEARAAIGPHLEPGPRDEGACLRALHGAMTGGVVLVLRGHAGVLARGAGVPHLDPRLGEDGGRQDGQRTQNQ